MTNWFVYLIECSDKSLYCGITTNVAKRLKVHDSKAGAKYTRGKGPFKLLYSEEFENHKAAAQREFQIKKWRRSLKENLIQSRTPGFKLKNQGK